MRFHRIDYDRIVDQILEEHGPGEWDIVVVLSGGIIAASELLGRLETKGLVTINSRMSLVKATAYRSAGETQDVTLDWFNFKPVGDRRILVIDDICDSGRTLTKVVAWAMGRKTKSLLVRTFAVLKRKGSEVIPDYFLREVEDGPWFVGNGMAGDDHTGACIRHIVEDPKHAEAD
jgi:hypoxanthine-guanine phosphoribosyltransferase